MTPGWYFTAAFLAAFFVVVVPLAVCIGRRDGRTQR